MTEENKTEDLIKYLQHIALLLDANEFESDEDKEHALSNAMEEIKGQEVRLARAPEGSQVMESFFTQCAPSDLLTLLQSFLDPFVDIAFHTFGSRVLEKLIQQVQTRLLHAPQADEKALQAAKDLIPIIKNLMDSLRGAAKQEGGGEKEKVGGWGWIELMADGKASHVIRALMELLVNLKEDSTAPIVSKKKAPVHQAITIQKSFWSIFLALTDDLVHPDRSITRRKKLENAAVHTYLSPALQVTLRGLHAIRQHQFVQVKHKKEMESLQQQAQVNLTSLLQMTTGTSTASLLKHRVGSHYLEVAVPLMDDDTFFALYTAHFRGNMLTLSQHDKANFVVQKLLTSARSAPHAGLFLSELVDHVEELMRNRAGIVASMLKTAVQFHLHEKELYSALLKYILGEQANQPKRFVPELYQRLAPKENSKLFHLSQILLELLAFPIQYAQVVASSFLELSDKKLLRLSCDPNGSRVLESLFEIEQLSQKFKNKAMTKLTGHWSALAKSKCGSRCLDNIFRCVNVQQKEMITKELAEDEAELKYDFYGRFALQNCKVDQYKLKTEHWKESLLQGDKKRKLFSELLDDSGDQPLTKKKKTSHATDPDSQKSTASTSHASKNTFASQDHKRIMDALITKKSTDSAASESAPEKKSTGASEIDDLFASAGKSKQSTPAKPTGKPKPTTPQRPAGKPQGKKRPNKRK